MGNLLWTLIVYICTAGIVAVVFRGFVEDKKENAANMTALFVKTHDLKPHETIAANQTPIGTAGNRFPTTRKFG